MQFDLPKTLVEFDERFGTEAACREYPFVSWRTDRRQSLHNNHPAYPSSRKFSTGRFEFDPSWVVIRVPTALWWLSKWAKE